MLSTTAGGLIGLVELCLVERQSGHDREARQDVAGFDAVSDARHEGAHAQPTEVAASAAWIVEVGAEFSDDSAEIQCLVVRRSCGLKGPDHTVASRLSAASRINTSR